MHTEPTTPFFIARGQEQQGPLPRRELERLLRTGELQPTDRCWTEGMEDWAEIVTLLPFPQPPPEPELQTETETFNPYTPPQANLARIRPASHYGGIGRGTYFAGSFILGIIQVVASETLGEESPATMAVLAATVIVSIGLVYQRLKNIGLSSWWCLAMIVPILNILVGLRCTVCQEGWADSRTLDSTGRTLCWVLGIFFVLIVAAMLALG